MLLFQAILLKLSTPVVIATGQTFQFSWFYSYLPLVYLLFTLLNMVRAAAKISAGGGVAPTTNFTAVSYPSSSTNYNSEDI